ncbi:hypothetical protein [Noviherbaspirillum pedocola]|uniref:Uncharacterized protein n=1 Tax=Noviherbaspirillum pedocola TaxID=2801341 RepID=A0A934SWV4_9BURK|nr:hypothetical protein [Noviherbaspirillum pedocola]MBK4737119.1 hypothetical protein [Noviherbaspirillum pedocola]
MAQAPAIMKKLSAPDSQPYDDAGSQKQGEHAREKQNAGPRLHVNEEEFEEQVRFQKEARRSQKLLDMEVSQSPSFLQRAQDMKARSEQSVAALVASDPALSASDPLQEASAKSTAALRNALDRASNLIPPVDIQLQHVDWSPYLVFSDTPLGSSAAPANEPPEKGGNQ